MNKSPACPICSKPIDDPATCGTFPFCSSRCRQVDFIRWWDGRYAVVEDLAPPTGNGPVPDQAAIEDLDLTEYD